jgi:hypothetical protein
MLRGIREIDRACRIDDHASGLTQPGIGGRSAVARITTGAVAARERGDCRIQLVCYATAAITQVEYLSLWVIGVMGAERPPA